MSFETDPIDQILNEIINKIIDGFRIEEPPIDAIAIARSLKIHVRCVKDLDKHIRGFVDLSRRGLEIVLQDHPYKPRQHFAAAHELGEIFMDDVAKAIGEPLDTWKREFLSDQFAGRFLCPDRWFIRDCARLNWNLHALFERYPTASHEVIARRWLQVSEEPTMVTIFDKGQRGPRVHYRPPLFPLEKQAQQLANETGERVTLSDDFMTVHAWPIHKEDWKREILRTVAAPW